MKRRRRRILGLPSDSGSVRPDNSLISLRQSQSSLSVSSTMSRMNPDGLIAGKYKASQVFPDKSYYDVKKIFLRLKNRKYYTKTCSICFENFKDEDQCRLLSCFHVFHMECIDDWFTRFPKCPLCNKEFRQSTDL